MKVLLYRDCMTTQWGFRLQGGRDLNQPLVIQRVFTNSPAEGELQRGDLIVSINGRDTEKLTHKQAQDLIKYGGGQLNFVIERPPPGRAHVAPLTPTVHTKAPTFPHSPTRAPTIIIPIQRRHSGPPSPVRSPVRSPSRPASTRKSVSPNTRMSSGFKPKKVTMNKFGGGGYDFGSGPATSPKYRPVQPNFIAHVQQAPPPPAQTQHYQAPAPPPQVQQYQAHHNQPAAPQYHPDPDAVDSSHVQFQQAQHYHQSHESNRPMTQEERGVDEEEYGGVTERKKLFLRGEQRRALSEIESDEDDYPTAPVWERRRIFAKSLNQTPRALNHTNKAFKPKRPILGDGISFGTDYTSPHTFAPPSSPPKPAPKPRPPPINTSVQDDIDSGAFAWSSTLKSDGLKPWEREQLIQDAYQKQPSHSVLRPAEHNIPKITQITAQSRARPVNQQPGGGQRSVSPVVPTKPMRTSQGHSPARSPGQSQYLAPKGHVSDVPDAQLVHLQYNSPMGLYSRDNVQDTFTQQAQGFQQAASPASQGKQAIPLGERDWSDSYVYKLVQEEKKTSNYGVAGQPNQTVTTTRVTNETRNPGQSPKRTVKESVTTSSLDPRFEDEIGISDF